MELTKKTTILFGPDLHERLSRLASQKKVSLGELIRHACVEQYGIATKEDRLAAVEELASLSLPVDDVRRMKKQSVVHPKELLR